MRAFSSSLVGAVRSVIRAPSFAAAIAPCFALGVAVSTTMGSIVDETLFRPFPYRDPGRLVSIRMRQQDGALNDSWAYRDFEALREASHTVRDLAAFRPTTANLAAAGVPPQRVDGERVSGSMWRLLGVPPLAGQPFDSTADRVGTERVVVLSSALWRVWFGGDPAIIGRSVRLDGVPHRVVAVMPGDFAFPENAKFWVPLRADPATANLDVNVVGRLAPGATTGLADQDLRAVAARLRAQQPRAGAEWAAAVIPFREALIGKGVRPLLLVLQAVATVVTLTAALNVVGLLFARGVTRERELATRMSLGATRAQIGGLIVLESAAMAALGGLLALPLSAAALAVLRGAIPPGELPAWLPLRLDGRLFAFALVLSLLVGAVAGVLPALRLSRMPLASVLNDGGRGSSEGRRTRRVRQLVVGLQIAAAVMLLTSATLLTRSYLRLQNAPPGFDADGVVTSRVTLSGERYVTSEQLTAAVDRLDAALRALPGVEGVGITSNVPFGGTGMTETVGSERSLAAGRGRSEVDERVITPGYFPALHIPVLQGRGFTPADRDSATPAVVVNRTFARRMLAGEEPIGARLMLGPAGAPGARSATVVGVVGDVHHWKLGDAAEPEIYLPYWSTPKATFDVVVRGRGNPETIARALTAVFHDFDPDLPISPPRPLAALVADASWQARVYAMLLGIFAVVGTSLAAFGVYSVAAEGTRQRSRELGVRAALGAEPGMLVGLLMRRGVRTTAAGVVVGLLLALVLAQALRSVLYGVAAADAASLAGGAAALSAIALAAFYVPARSVVAGLSPTSALRGNRP